MKHMHDASLVHGSLLSTIAMFETWVKWLQHIYVCVVYVLGDGAHDYYCGEHVTHAQLYSKSVHFHCNNWYVWDLGETTMNMFVCACVHVISLCMHECEMCVPVCLHVCYPHPSTHMQTGMCKLMHPYTLKCRIGK